MTIPFIVHAASLAGGCVFIATLVLAIAALLVRRQGQPAGIQHLIWVSAFSGILIAPVFSVFVPSSHVTSFAVSAIAQGANSDGPGPTLAPTTTGWPEALDPDLTIRSARVVFGFWIAGVLIVGISAVREIFGLRRLRQRSALQVFQGIDLVALIRQSGVRRACELRVAKSQFPSGAFTWGIFRPTILLPRASLRWSRECLEAVLLHELAHVRRRDALGQAVALVSCALYWFHPGVWRASRAMRSAADVAADESALLAGSKRSAYAKALLACASQIDPNARVLSQIGLSMATGSKVDSRIRSVLNPANEPRLLAPAETIKAAGGVVLLLLIAIFARPSIVLADGRGSTPSASNLAEAGRSDVTGPELAQILLETDRVAAAMTVHAYPIAPERVADETRLKRLMQIDQINAEHKMSGRRSERTKASR